MGLLVEGVEGDQALERRRRLPRPSLALQLGGEVEEHPLELGLELLTPFARPRFIGVLGQEIAPVRLQRGLQVAGPAGGFEAVDVNRELVSVQAHGFALHEDGVGAELLARVVDRLPQIDRSGLRIGFGPEQIDQLLAVAPVLRTEGQDLDQRLGLGPAPGFHGDVSPAGADREPPQKSDLHPSRFSRAR